MRSLSLTSESLEIAKLQNAHSMKSVIYIFLASKTFCVYNKYIATADCVIAPFAYFKLVVSFVFQLLFINVPNTGFKSCLLFIVYCAILSGSW